MEIIHYYVTQQLKVFKYNDGIPDTPPRHS